MQLFDRGYVLIETGCLLASSFTCGLCSLAIERRNSVATYAGAAFTFLLGGAFVALELSEFVRMIASRRGPDAQRLPVRLFHAGRHAWAARHSRPVLACW
jgi:heme/copper-type cytochrome/quinol oxidase subunit 3